MALQTKTYSVGDYAWRSWSNAYVISLILTEESVDTVNNTSLISYVFKISTTGNNGFYSGPYSWTISIGGHTIAINDFHFNVPYTQNPEEQIMAQGQITVAHNADGTLSMPFSAPIPSNIQNYSSAGPPAMTVEDTMDLTPIAVAPTTIPVVVGNTQLNSIVFNGQPVTHLIYNGTTLY